MKQTVFKKVMVKDRLPDKRKKYFTNKGKLNWCKKHMFYNVKLFNVFHDIKVSWWLEEIELPSEEEICSEGFDNSTCVTAFAKGANYILNKLS